MGGSYIALDPARQVARVVLPWRGERWVLDFTGFQGELYRELARRDFTVDALAVPLLEALGGQAEVIDYFHGMEDLAARRLRALNDEVFQADPVRMLRAVRLAGSLEFTIDSATSAALRRDSPLLTRSAPERLREEFMRLLSLPQGSGLLRVMDQVGLLTTLLPELEAARDVEQPKEHYWDVLEHSLATVRMVEAVLRASGKTGNIVLVEVPWTPLLADYFAFPVGAFPRSTLVKLAGLLHDIGKPQTKRLEPDGRVRFLGHQNLGAAMSRGILQRLRFSRQEVATVEGMVLHHLRPGLMSGALPLPTRRAIYRYYRDVGDVAIDTLYLALADYLAARGPRLDPNDWLAFAGKIRYVLRDRLQQREQGAPARLVSGHDLLQELALTPGPLVGALLEGIREAQATGEVKSREEALAYAQHLLEHMGREAQHRLRENHPEGVEP
jgi:poly(A) polymerase